MRKRWTQFEIPKERPPRGQASTTLQAESVVDSTLEIIDVSGGEESPRREVHVAAAESSSPHVPQIDGGPTETSRKVRHTFPLLILYKRFIWKEFGHDL